MADAIQQVDVSTMPITGRTQAEFGKQPFAPSVDAELAALEAQINAASLGTKHPVPVAPVIEAPLASTAPVQAQATQPPTTAVVAPVTPAPAQTPDKFLNQDGSLNSPAFDKSAEAINKFLEGEKELTQFRQWKAAQAQGQAAALQPPVFQQQVAPDTAQSVLQTTLPGQQLDPNFVKQFEADYAKDPAGARAALQAAVQQVAAAQVPAQQVQQVAQETKELRMKVELMQIAQTDPWVLTEEGIRSLMAVRAQKPFLSGSPTPWMDAYQYMGRKSQGQPQAQTTRLTAPAFTTPQAPPAAQLPQVAPTALNPNDLTQFVKAKFPGNLKAQADYLENFLNQGAKAAGRA